MTSPGTPESLFRRVSLGTECKRNASDCRQTAIERLYAGPTWNLEMVSYRFSSPRMPTFIWSIRSERRDGVSENEPIKKNDEHKGKITDSLELVGRTDTRT